MRRRYFIQLALALLLTLPAFTLAQQLSLDECISSAISSSPMLAKARAEQSVKEHQAKSSSASRLPSLALSGTGSWVSETMELNLPIMPQPISFGDNTTYDMLVAVRAPLYTGGSLSSRQRSMTMAAEAMGMQTQSDSLTLLLQVRSAYFTAQMAQANLDAVQASMDRLERHHKDLEAMREVGMADEESLLELQAAIAEVRQKVASVEAMVETARLELGRLVGRPGEAVTPADDLGIALMDGNATPSRDDQNRPDLEALSMLSESLQAAVRAQKGSLLPTVTAEAGYHYGKPGVDMIANEAMGYATASVRLSWTLFDFGQRSHDIQAVVQQRRSLEQQRAGAEQMWTTRLAASMKKLESSRIESAAAKERFTLQQRRYALLEGKLAQGQASESSLLDAEDDLTLAELDLARALAGERLTEAEVLYALGR